MIVDRRTDRPPVQAPDVSVIIPTRNRPQWLGRCLTALADATAPSTSVEVIVVDDAGEHPLAPVLDRVSDGLDITLLRRPSSGGASLACNTGASFARGEVLAFTSADCAPQRGWVEALNLAATQYPGSLIAGRTETAKTAHRWVLVSDAITQHLQRWSAVHNVPPFAPIHNMALPRRRFEAIGGFAGTADTPRGEDRDLVARWAEKGWETAVAEQALVVHDRDLSYRDFLRQHHRYGRASFHFSEQLRRRQQDPRLFKGIWFYLVMLYRAYRAAGWLGLPAVAVAQIATAVGYLRERVSQRT
ncbi:glycosyltransferase [Euzebya tangerina]|uniref:glycosyltransferase n=1 Tax=Euzebya tangerina TaxID=591198 RepID=UPI0013C31BB0|nr:glycosyltransferase family 2 protein [Euzebya tangerina]